MVVLAPYLYGVGVLYIKVLFSQDIHPHPVFHAWRCARVSTNRKGMQKTHVFHTYQLACRLFCKIPDTRTMLCIA
jgi:hypothetical protein